MQTIERDAKVGIFSSRYVARIYEDRIVLTAPYIKWTDNSGKLAYRKTRITDRATLATATAAMADGAEDSAWEAIGLITNDPFLARG